VEGEKLAYGYVGNEISKNLTKPQIESFISIYKKKEFWNSDLRLHTNMYDIFEFISWSQLHFLANHKSLKKMRSFSFHIFVLAS
jgi:hypothetical protein